MHTLILGAGYSGAHIARLAKAWGTVSGTRRSDAGIRDLDDADISAFLVDGHRSDEFDEELRRTTHLVISVPPGRKAPFDDPMLKLLSPLTRQQLPSLSWIAYLSTVGVYGNHDGAWVDENTPCTSVQARSIMRREAEVCWQAYARGLSVPISVLRLSGIYGPGRNAVLDARNGRKQMLIKPGQVFNRIHVSDLAQAVMRAAEKSYDGVLNITDDVPAPPQDVIRFAHDLLGQSHPEAVDFETAEISEMARSFYSENKRIGNRLSRSELGLTYRYPSYKEGLQSIASSLSDQSPR